LVIRGRYEEAEKSIQQAAQLANEPLPAFQLVLAEILKIKRTRQKIYAIN
jgi:hypothetical protein